MSMLRSWRAQALNILLLPFFSTTAVVWAQVTGPCNTLASQSNAEVGCYLSATEDLGVLQQSTVFWHLDEYPTRAAAEAAKGPNGTIVESFEKIWLYTIAESEWRASAGKHIATIGPLLINAGKQYTARYMEATFTPGMKAPIHRHAGPEAWYILTGAQCLETPNGIEIARSGEESVVQEGLPMALSSVGTETRQSVVLVLHDSSQPWSTMENEWKPKGLCPE